jgi:hypothetical protein
MIFLLLLVCVARVASRPFPESPTDTLFAHAATWAQSVLPRKQNKVHLSDASACPAWLTFHEISTECVACANALPIAVLEDLSDCVLELIQSGKPITWDVIASAAQQGDVKIMRLLVDAGAKLDVWGPDGTTPLMEAAKACQFKVMSTMLSGGADFQLESDLGETAGDIWTRVCFGQTAPAGEM